MGEKKRILSSFPWLIGITTVLLIICWSVRQLSLNFHRVTASYYDAQVVTYYGFSWDVVCFLGGNYRRSEWNCRPDWPYETYLVVLGLLLITLIVTWIVLRKKWQRPPTQNQAPIGTSEGTLTTAATKTS